MPKDPYDVLGLTRGAHADEIKKAYRQLSKEWHPDRHKGDKGAEARFKEINEAYEILSDPEKKQRFDQFGSAGGPGGFQGGGFDFSNMGGGMGDMADLFESFFGGNNRSRRPSRGADREVRMRITLAEAVSGVQRTFSIQRLAECDTCKGTGAKGDAKIITCATCGGTGQVTRVTQSFFGAIQQRGLCGTCQGSGKVPETPCGSCSGTGRKEKREDVTVEIPAGISSGQSLLVRGGGDKGLPGQEAGDLYVNVEVEDDPRFRRDGDDIHSVLSAHPLDVLLGATMTIDTVQGPVTLEVPAGTQPHQILRVKGKGMPVLSTSRHGDHYVEVEVTVPRKLSREEKRILEEWKKARS